jgi:SAM-dependent methyltransferase
LAAVVTEPSLTGERTLPGIWYENYWFRRHEATYLWVAATLDLRGRTVLDAGVGEGYGGQGLSTAGAGPVLGLDLDPVSLSHIARTYPGVTPVRANLVRLPLAAASVDVVVSAQTVEHLWDQAGFVDECARVLRPGGLLVLTTPNRPTFPPGNVFHSRELDAAELAALVARRFRDVDLRGLHHGPRLLDADRRHGGVVEAQLAAAHSEWDAGLRRTVSSVSADDFVVGAASGSLDLVALARRRT